MRKTPAKPAGKSRPKASPTKLKRPTKTRPAVRKPAAQGRTLPRAVASPLVAPNQKSRLHNPHSDTKQARVIAMLRAPAGATVDAIAAAAGWQQHSVRGFLAGVIKKKLALHLISERGEHGRVYRVVKGKPTIATKVRQAA